MEKDRTMERELRIGNWHGYKVYSDGRIFGKKKQMTIRLNEKGYECVSLFIDGKSVYARMHRILAILFIPNPENKPCVNHKDGNRSNNDLSNLEWCTYSENIIHSIKRGSRRSKAFRESHKNNGELNPGSKLTLEQVEAIRELYSNGYSQNKLERIFGVDQSRISLIVNNKQWRIDEGVKSLNR